MPEEPPTPRPSGNPARHTGTGLAGETTRGQDSTLRFEPNQPLEVIGDFEVLSKLGQGGMGSVYRARQVSLDRQVALKILPANFEADADYVARFQREARVAANLKHPNLVRVYTSGVAAGSHFIAMELIEGETLAHWIKRGPLPPLEALRIVLDVARALECGWRTAQLIHRDIKPGNIFLSTDCDVKLGDLGLAKIVGSDTTGLTQTGAAMGTPHYISPEQARGDKDLDFRADIYSLGCTLYQMLTGQTPYGGSDPVAVFHHHIHSPPPAILKVLPQCPLPLARLVAKMLKKQRRERPASYEELIAQIESVCAQLDPALAVPPPAAGADETPKAGTDRRAVPTGSGGLPPPGALPKRPSKDAAGVASPAKSKLPLYGGIAAALLVLGLAGWLLWPKEEKLTAAQRWARDHAGDKTPAVENAGLWQNALEAVRLPDDLTDPSKLGGLRREGSGLLCEKTDDALLTLKPVLTGPYEFRAEITPELTGSDHAMWWFPVNRGDRFIGLKIAPSEFRLVHNGPAVDLDPTLFQSSKRRRVLLRLEPEGDSVRATLLVDDREITSQRLNPMPEISSHWGIAPRQRISLGSELRGSGRLQIHQAEVRALPGGTRNELGTNESAVHSNPQVPPPATVAEASKGGPALPAKGWQPLIPVVESLKNLRGITVLPDHWLRLEHARLPIAVYQRDVALRARIRHQSIAAVPALVVRNTSSGSGGDPTTDQATDSEYLVSVDQNDRDNVKVIERSDQRRNSREIGKFSLPRKLNPGEEYELAVAVSGKDLAVYFEGRFLGRITDAVLPGAGLTLWANNGWAEFAHIEWTRLEAESSPAAGANSASNPAASSSPPADAKQYGNSHFKVISERKSWWDAKKRAQEMGVHLATIDSPEENQWLAETFLQGSIYCLWIGAHRDVGGGWKWENGKPLGFAGWEPRNGTPQPDPGEYRDYVTFRKASVQSGERTKAVWVNRNDGGEDIQHPFFLVEWEGGPSDSPGPAVTK